MHFPAAAPGVNLLEVVNYHPFMYQECAGRANFHSLVGTAEMAVSCLKAVVGN
jgi:hypothetical protein